jgi:hypothetical protein
LELIKRKAEKRDDKEYIFVDFDFSAAQYHGSDQQKA